ncbi:MAG: hypothetical protein WKF50_02060 [Nocardioides sp.]
MSDPLRAAAHVAQGLDTDHGDYDLATVRVFQQAEPGRGSGSRRLTG